MCYSLILLLETGPEIIWTYPSFQSCMMAAVKLNGMCIELNLLEYLK